jgi:uncharacterized beta-barrel protein YwiB (DUF1934 family)
MQRVMLTIKGTQFDSGHDDRVEFMTEGRIFKNAEGYLLEYDESELTGVDGCTTRLILKDGSVTLLRSGSSDMHMIFSPHSVYESTVTTPEGTRRISIFAMRVESQLFEQSGSLCLEYELSVGDLSTVNKLDLSFKSMEGCIN